MRPSPSFFTPGSFVNLTLQAPLESHVQIPAAALLVRQSKTFVASVDRDRVRFSAVSVGATDGAQVVVTQGVREGDTLAINLPDEITDGARIQPVPLRRGWLLPLALGGSAPSYRSPTKTVEP
mgnify:CR=1 FL=1